MSDLDWFEQDSEHADGCRCPPCAARRDQYREQREEEEKDLERDSAR